MLNFLNWICVFSNLQRIEKVTKYIHPVQLNIILNGQLTPIMKPTQKSN